LRRWLCERSGSDRGEHVHGENPSFRDLCYRVPQDWKIQVIPLRDFP
jgi:hypothetical protein